MSYLISKDASQLWQAPSLIMTQRKEDTFSPGVVPFAGKSQSICHSGARVQFRADIASRKYRYMNDDSCILQPVLAHRLLYQV